MNAVKRILVASSGFILVSRDNHALFGVFARNLAGIASFSAHQTPPGHIMMS